MKSALFLLLTSAFTAASNVCDSGWTLGPSKKFCYYTKTAPTNSGYWDSSLSQCIAKHPRGVPMTNPPPADLDQTLNNLQLLPNTLVLAGLLKQRLTDPSQWMDGSSTTDLRDCTEADFPFWDNLHHNGTRGGILIPYNAEDDSDKCLIWIEADTFEWYVDNTYIACQYELNPIQDCPPGFLAGPEDNNCYKVGKMTGRESYKDFLCSNCKNGTILAEPTNLLLEWWLQSSAKSFENEGYGAIVGINSLNRGNYSYFCTNTTLPPFVTDCWKGDINPKNKPCVWMNYPEDPTNPCIAQYEAIGCYDPAYLLYILQQDPDKKLVCPRCHEVCGN